MKKIVVHVSGISVMVGCRWMK